MEGAPLNGGGGTRLAPDTAAAGKTWEQRLVILALLPDSSQYEQLGTRSSQRQTSDMISVATPP